MAFVVAAFRTAENRELVRAVLERDGHTSVIFGAGAAAVTEALANAMKYAGSRDGNPKLSVSLRRQGGSEAMMEVLNTVGERTAATSGIDGSGLGAQLLQAFSQQIGGPLQIEETEDHYRLRIVFEVKPLTEAEARISGGVTDA